MSTINYDATINMLKSGADCTLYTYGVGDSQKQATPSYIIELAKDNPSKTYELIHCDPHCDRDEKTDIPLCLKGREWTVLPSSEEDIYLFQHKVLPNLKTRIVQRSFPTTPTFDPEFQGYIKSKLKNEQEVFLGVHNACFTDMQCCLGETFNKFREKYAKQIHFYIQAADIPAFIYKGAYSPLMGLFAYAAKNSTKALWQAFQRVFSQSNPSHTDVNKVREGFRKFLAVRANRLEDEKIVKAYEQTREYGLPIFKTSEEEELYRYARTFITLRDRDLSALTDPEEDLYRYLDNPLQNRLIVIPIEKLTAQLLNAEPGQEKLPESSNLSTAFKTYLALVLLTNLAGIAVWNFMNWRK